MKRIAYICDICKKAYYSLEELDQVNNSLYNCKNQFECRGRFLRQNRNKKFPNISKIY
jgi:hypothetical protein